MAHPEKDQGLPLISVTQIELMPSSQDLACPLPELMKVTLSFI